MPSNVTVVPAASPSAAEAHFSARLGFETDCWDVHDAMARGMADFVVLDANPLDDITNTRRIAHVYLRGRAVDRAALRARWTQ